MKLAVFIEGVDVSDAVSATSIEITQNLSDRSSQAHLSFIQQSVGEAGILAYFDEAHYDQDVYSADVQPMYTLTITNADTGDLQFSGSIRQIHPDRKRKGLRFSDCDCLDWMTVLDEGYVVRELYSGWTDQQIIQDLIGKYAPGITALTENIKSTLTLPAWAIVETPLREALDEIAEYSGCEYRIDYAKNFLYFEPSDHPAPFALSSNPTNFVPGGGFVTWDEATGSWDEAGDITWDDIANAGGGGGSGGGGGNLTWDEINESWDEIQGSWDDMAGTGLPTYPIDAFLDYKRDAVKIINAATVLGTTLPDGNRLRATYGDFLSQQQYGIHPYVEVNDQIDIGTVASLRAQAIVEQNAQPQEIISLKTFHDGLQVGQSLPLYYEAYLISGTYLIRDMRIKQVSHSRTEYTLSLGARETDTLRVLKKIDARSRRITDGALAVPVTGSVTDSSISLDGISANYIGSVNAHSIIGKIEAKQIDSVNADIIVGKIISSKIESIDADTIQGVITAEKIGSIKATVIEGVIVSSQLADGIIDSVSKLAAPLRTIVNSATEPPLPDPNFPLGNFYYNTTTGYFFRNDGDTWNRVEEGTAVVGKLEYYHIGTIKAEKIVGLIVAAQIQTINAGSIIGQINADHIGTVYGSSITSTIDAAYIGGVQANLIQGTITADKISSIHATVIQDKIVSTQIGSIDAITVNIGQLKDGQIEGIQAGKLTAGTINANTINIINIHADNITVGLMSASRIGAGTITASVSIQSPLISGGSITGGSITGGSITGATMTVDAGTSQVFTGPAVLDPTYGSTAVKAADTAAATSYFMSRGLIVQQSGSTIASVNRSPTDSTAGEMTIYRGGQLMLFANGTNGIMRATGFQTNALLGNSITINYTKTGGAAGFMIFSGGILTSSG